MRTAAISTANTPKPSTKPRAPLGARRPRGPAAQAMPALPRTLGGLSSRPPALQRLAPARAASSQPRSPPSPAPPRDYFANDSRPIILYDGVCNFCNGGVNMILDNDPSGVFRFAALQSSAGRALLSRCGRSPDDLTSMVLVERDGCHVRSAAALAIASKLGGAIGALSLPLWLLPRAVRDAGYDFIADNRYKILGIRDACRIGDQRHGDRFIE
ncbi:unnamed protein product [Ostreobium quekettii]|uniref:Thiol-disulfide oxidoreductase DCC n=1 Tax=Ostreobium quekettii TaxID=121088 RepID=A0A8S1JCY0_9CHLO|nr:unnamed protein product [Ostreobium quekettii]